MQSTNVRQIKAALVEQAFLGSTRVSCLLGPVVAASLVVLPHSDIVGELLARDWGDI